MKIFRFFLGLKKERNGWIRIKSMSSPSLVNGAGGELPLHQQRQQLIESIHWYSNPSQQDLSDLISTFENLELEAHNHDLNSSIYPSVITLHMFLYLIAQRYCDAKFLWKRSVVFRSLALSLSICWDVGKALFQKDYATAFRCLSVASWSVEELSLAQNLKGLIPLSLSLLLFKFPIRKKFSPTILKLLTHHQNC